MTSSVTRPPGAATKRWPRWAPWAVGAIGLIAVQFATSSASGWPTNWYAQVAREINRFQKWASLARLSNPVFTGFFGPIGDAVQWVYERFTDFGLALPWFWLSMLAFVVIARTGRYASATLAAVGFAYGELVGLREPAMQTIAFSLVSVLICALIGFPLGVWAGTRPNSERVLRPLVDALQSLPVTLYIGPAVLFLGIGAPPGIVATVLFGIGPLIRIVGFGIRQVPAASVEAGEMFGSTQRQLLWKVRLPQAMPTILTGVNQTIMAALAMAVIGGLVGAGGLGAEVFRTLTERSPGRGVLVGLSLVGIAIAFDRFCRALVARPARPAWSGRRFWATVGGGLVVAGVVGRLIGWKTAPWTFDRDILEPIDDFVIWIRDTFGDELQSVNDFIVADVAIRIRDLLGETLAWPTVISATALLAWWCKGWRLAVFAIIGLGLIGFAGRWASSIETLAQLLIAVVLAIVIAIPIGIFVGTRPRAEAAVNPVLELLQTFPSVVYAIPFTMIFAVGYVPGILSTMLYAIPPGVRLAAMAVRDVDTQTLEASTTFGATPWQRLIGVRIPMAFDGIMLGVNQVVMMSMSMILISGLTGSQGLGYELISGLRKPDVGLNVEASVAILVIGILLDRMTQGLAGKVRAGQSSAAR